MFIREVYHCSSGYVFAELSLIEYGLIQVVMYNIYRIVCNRQTVLGSHHWCSLCEIVVFNGHLYVQGVVCSHIIAMKYTVNTLHK